jgi:hypothetical protein
MTTNTDDSRKLADTVREARDLLDRTKRAKWSTPAEASKMGKSGYAPRKAQLAEWVMELRAALDALVSLAEQRLHRCVFPTCVEGEKPKWCGHCGDAERVVSAERELSEAREWIDHNWITDDDEPATQTLAQTLEAIFRWGDGAWGVAGRAEERAVSAEAALRAAQARAEEAEKALAVFDHMGDAANEARRLYAESGVVPIQALVVADRLWGSIKALRRRSVLAASPQAGEAPGGGLLEQPMRREIGVDAPDFGPVLGEPAGDEVGSADSSAAGVDGAGDAPGHHEPVGERQGRQPALPTRLLVDAAGFVWRDFGEDWVSGCPFNPDNEPLPGPITVYVPQAGEHQTQETAT